MYINQNSLECSVIPEGKKYLAYVGIGKGADRKRIKARGFTEDEAMEKLKQKLIELGYIQAPNNTPKLNIIVNEFTSIPDFVREYRVNEIMGKVESDKIKSRTAENYIYMLKPFENYFRFVTVGDITVDALNQFFRAMELEKGKNGDYLYSQVSLKRMVFVIHSMFKRAIDKKWLRNNPFEDTRYQAPKSKKTTEDIEGLTPEELKEFIGIIKQYPIIYNPIMVMLNTGMRTQEAIALKWGDIDFDKNLIYVRQAATMTVEFDEEGKIKKRQSVISCPKTPGSKRDIGLTPEARDILLAWREEAPLISKTKTGDNDFVFGYEKKPSFTYCAFRDRVNDYLIRQTESLDKMRLHRLRHTVGTLLAAEGRQDSQIMRQLGITQEKTLQRYIDKKGNKKIIAGNVEAISKGLYDMLNQTEHISVDSVDIQAILSDSKAKAFITALAGAIQGV